jgi:DNA-binding LytR/AlgR family response regulator
MKTMPVKTRCLITDDEPLALDALATLLEKIPDVDVVARCGDAVEALHILHREHIDLIFLDIQMPELTGIEMLRSLDNPPKVIFTTAYREHAVEAFELDVVDYLVKPVSLERLLKAVNRYFDRMTGMKGSASLREGSPSSGEGKEPGTLTFYSDKKTHKIDARDIMFVEGLKDYALVHTGSGRLITRETMKNLERMLTPFDFIRVHRSWIIPYRRLSSWTSHSVFIGKTEIPVGKTYRRTVMEYLENKNS